MANANVRGNAVVIVNEKFGEESNLELRKGAKIDKDILISIIRGLGFKCINEKDSLNVSSTRWQHEGYMKENCDCLSCRVNTTTALNDGTDCFLFAISTHGREEKGSMELQFSDGKPVKLKSIVDVLNSDSLRGKKKILIVQACRSREDKAQANDPGITTAILEEQEMMEAERMNLFRSFVKERINTETVLAEQEVLSEATRLKVKGSATLVLVELLMDENVLTQIEQHNNLLKKFCQNNLKAQKYLLGGMEQLLGKFKATLMPKVKKIFYKLYCVDILEENVFIEWSETVESEFVSQSVAQEIHKKASPFIKWLKEAEEEGDSNGDDGDEVQKQPKTRNDDTDSDCSNGIVTTLDLPADFIVIYACWSGRYAKRDLAEGSWLLLDLKTKIESHFVRNSSLNFLQTLTKTVAAVAERETVCWKRKEDNTYERDEDGERVKDPVSSGMKSTVTIAHTLREPLIFQRSTADDTPSY
ncbi:uncharacterized protein LOC128209297 isoform X2 [Mya arenaria]|nr:uncharacterized protein LOC128209297 isoform X2 [Mya arenaria]XP_052769237.1 uncharacterized protein LOC128209297 isoform X2 [Mya arenaria]